MHSGGTPSPHGQGTLSTPSHASAGQEAAAPPTAAELTPEQLLQAIVNEANKVLSRRYSLVDFDSLRGGKLLQVVNDLFTTLLPRLAVDFEVVSGEQQSQAIAEMLEFLLKTLGYKVPTFIQSSFPKSFADAEPTVIYPVLYWVLTHMELNTKRVYLSRFLQPLEIPEDIRAQDEDVRNLYAQYLQLRSSFVQTHRHVDALREAFADPVEQRRNVAALEEEKSHLQGHIQAAEKKLANVREKEAFLSESRNLKAALDENAKLAEKYVELQQATISADARRAEVSNRLQNLRRDAVDGRVEAMVRRMQDEIKTNRIKLEEQLPLELDAKQKENAELNKLVSEPLDLATLIAESNQLDDALRKLNDTVRERQRPGEDGSSLITIKQQLQRVSARKAEVMNTLNSLQADNAKVVSNIREREMTIHQLRTANSMMGEEEFKEFSAQVRAKKAATEGMRTRLAEMHAEWGVLTFTKEVLQQQYKELESKIGDLESKLGLQGYGRTMEMISRLAEERDAVEELKGKTLEELSRVVQDFNLAIREGRNRLAPLISELRTVRQNAAEVDEEWQALKRDYERLEGTLMESMQNLDEQVTRVKDAVNLNEALYHRLTVQSILHTAQRKRITDERNYRSRPDAALDPHYKTYTDLLSDTTKNLEERTKKTQSKRREVDENHDGSVQQVAWFNSLKKILEAKLKCMHADNEATGDGAGVGRRSSIDADIQQVMSGGGGGGGARRGLGVDMLVLGNP